MTETLSRADELRNDIDNLYFSRKYYIGVLAELEQLGRTHTRDFKLAEANLKAINHNLKRLESELEAEDARAFEKELEESEDPYYFSDGMHW